MTDKPADEDEKTPHELRNLFVKEISLVDRAANRRKFLLFKSESGQGGNPMPQATLTEAEVLELDTALNTPTETEGTVLAAMETAVEKALSSGDKNKVTAALRLLGGVEDSAVKALVKELSAAASGSAPEKVESAKKAEPKPEEPVVRKEAPVPKADEKPKEPEKVPELPEEVTELAKRGDYVAITKAAGENPGVMALVVELLKSRDGEIQDLKKFQVEQIAKADAEEVARIVDEADLPGAAREDQIALVKGMDSDAREKFAALAKGIQANLKAGVSAGQVGTPRRGGPTSTAWDTIQKRAKELVAKSATKLDQNDAFAQVIEDDPDLARQYRAEVAWEG